MTVGDEVSLQHYDIPFNAALHECVFCFYLDLNGQDHL